MKKVDKLGRIVIPQELREKYDLTNGTTVEFIDTGDGVALKHASLFCKICNSKIGEAAAFPLCEKCICDIVKAYEEKTVK